MERKKTKEEYALEFVEDRLKRTIQYATSREATNIPAIIAPLNQALLAISLNLIPGVSDGK